MMIHTKQKRKSKSHRAAGRPNSPDQTIQPFIDHAQELRRRLYYIAGSVVLWGAAIYGVQQHVVNALLRPAQGQHFIYTTPGGGVDFLFRICIYGGIVLSLPVIIYNALRFIEPVLSQPSQRFAALGSLAATALAIVGVVFGYYIGLPAALHFLLHQFTTVQIQPLVTIQSYLGFVIVYMFGSALLFQLPLLLLFINRIKPLKPKRLLHYERWVVLVAFILAGLMNPSPNIISQLLVAGPFIIAYQVAILIIAVINRGRKPNAPPQLREQDAATQARRLVQAADLQQTATKPPTLPPQPRPVLSEIKLMSATRRRPDQQKYVSPTRQPRPFSDIRANFNRPAAGPVDSPAG